MATLASSFAHPILHRFILRRPTTAIIHSALKSQPKLSLSPLKATPFFSSTRTLFSSTTIHCAVTEQLANDVVLSDQTQSENEIDTIPAESGTEDSKKSNLAVVVVKSPPPPILSIKEKKDLASYAHSLGKKLKSWQVGKSGVTGTVVNAVVETLEANELLKLKVHNSCPGELDEVVKQLEETTGSVAVGKIGRTVILYRPSLTKQKAEEKKKQAQILHLKRRAKFNQTPQSRRPVSEGEETREFGRGQRGRSRY